MEHAEAIRLAALLAVIERDDEYQRRRIIRWYAKTFHTSLPVVEDLDFDDVLQTWFECEFEELDPHERSERAHEFTETAAEKQTRLEEERSEKQREEDFAANVPQTFDQVAPTKPADLPKPEQKKVLAQHVGDDMLKRLESLPPMPEIRMTFDENLSEDAMLDSLVLPPPPEDP